MIFGRRPFGEGKSQDRILSEGIILNGAAQLEFPNDPKTPKVTEEAKDFLRTCLTADQRYRYTRHYLFMHYGANEVSIADRTYWRYVTIDISKSLKEPRKSSS